MNPANRKEMVEAYKQREVVGGVYAICCQPTGKRMIETTTDLKGIRNRFDFSVNMNTCIHHVLQGDWKAYGASAFSFEVLETVPKKEEESMEDYQKGLKLLRDMLREETPADGLYA